MSKKNAKTEVVSGSNAEIHELGPGCYAISADGCPNTGVVVGERGVLVIDAQPTNELGQQTLEKIREITDKPIRILLLTHFHGDSTSGAAAFEPGEVIASDLTKRMMETRGLDDLEVLKNRFPETYENSQAAPLLAIPTMTIASSMSIDLVGKEVRLMHLGRGHTMGDLVVWVPETGVIYVGDMVQTKSSPYCGDAHLSDWPRALDRIAAFRPKALVPGRGRPAVGTAAVAKAIETTRDYVVTLRDAAAACAESKMGLFDTYMSIGDALAPRFKSFDDFIVHLPFNVARAYDEAQGLDQPQVWTTERAADLDDALTRTKPVAENAAVEDTEPTESAAEPQPDVSEPADESVDSAGAAEQGAETEETVELVTDSDFAASLLDGDEETQEGAAEEDTLLLNEEEVVGESEDSDKVLEKADA